MSRMMSSELVSASGGCDRCSVTFEARNAQPLAAKHHDKTGHPTWVEKVERIYYGRGRGKPARRSEQGRLI
jgi:hypothetical protein